ncbi:adenine phosphoribosyltransferase [Deltaproteobacteria bacterium TL4]
MAHQHLKQLIRTIPDFPKPGIQFRDITTLLSDGPGFHDTIEILVKRYEGQNIDKIVGIEARGFIVGAPLAIKLGIGFVPVRKPGKLPGATVHVSYALEYGTDTLHVHKDAVSSGSRVLLIDDLLATGGTLAAACKLMEEIGAEVVECACIVELPALKGREKLKNYPVYTMIEFEGD